MSAANSHSGSGYVELSYKQDAGVSSTASQKSFQRTYDAHFLIVSQTIMSTKCKGSPAGSEPPIWDRVTENAGTRSLSLYPFP
jgi:hypothetical protein